MTKNFVCAAFAIGTLVGTSALMAQDSQLAQEPQARQGNAELIKMLRAGVPESTLLSEIEILAGGGAKFDITPSGIVELQRAGATEKVLNTVVWAQMSIAPSIEIQKVRGVFYRAGANAAELKSFLLWPEFSTRWSTWPFYAPGGTDRALAASPYVVQIAESSPTLLVQGFRPESGWELVRMGRGNQDRVVHLKRKHAFSSDFFSDSMFEHDALRPIALTNAGADSFTVRPESPLEVGDYALCGQLPEGGWMRACYEFHVTGM